MKKILSLLCGLMLCLVLVGCDNSGSGIPFDYSSWEAKYNIQNLSESTGFLIEYSSYSNIPNNSRMIYGDSEDYDDDDYDYYDDDYEDGVFDGFEGFDFSSIIIAVKGEIIYLATDEYSMYLDFSNETKLVMYAGMVNPLTGKFTWAKKEAIYTEEATKDMYKSQYADFYEYLVPYSSLYGSKVKFKCSDAVCARMCDKYVIEDSSDYDESLGNMVICIDNEYGFCLKMGYEMKYEGKTYSYGLKCTRFEENPILTLPSV